MRRLLPLVPLVMSLVAALPEPSSACTLYKSPLHGDRRVSGNFDWYDRFPNHGGVLFEGPANVRKRGVVVGAAIPAAEWVSKWRSVAFSPIGVEFPTLGVNERGLTMGSLVFSGGRFPPESDPRPAVTTSQFTQYNLDLSESIDEVIASAANVRPFSSVMTVHYFVCDASSECAVLEYLDGQLTVRRGSALPYEVVTNSRYSTAGE